MSYRARAATLTTVLISAAIAVAGCASSAGQPLAGTGTNATSTASATSAASGPPTTTATTVVEPDLPAAVAQVEHGGTYWGVYVTVVRSGTQGITQEDKNRLDVAASSLQAMGYEPDTGDFDPGCEQGVVEQLRLDPQRLYAAARIYFATQAEAQQFVTAYQPGIVGTAQVTLYCMD